MSNNTIASIEMDEHRFKKLSKKLQKKINEKSSADIKLNVIQESLSEALGFRNLHDLKGTDKAQPLVLSTDVSEEILKDLFFSSNIEENVEIAKIIFPFIYPEQDKYKERSDIFYTPFLILFRLFLNLLNENQNLSETLTSCENKNIFEIFLSKPNLNEDLKRDIQKYFSLRESNKKTLKYNPDAPQSPPYYNTDNEIAIWYKHDYQKVVSLINTMTKIRKDNILIYKRNWVVNSGVHEKWRYSDSIFKGDFYHKSWLHMNSYISITETLDYLSPNYDFRLSDLILYKINIISPDLEHHIDNLLKVIFDNYEKCLHISTKLEHI